MEDQDSYIAVYNYTLLFHSRFIFPSIIIYYIISLLIIFMSSMEALGMLSLNIMMQCS